MRHLLSRLPVFAIASTSIVACKVAPATDSAVKIAGGEETSLYPEVRHFEIDRAKGRICTGIVVSPSTVLLAAHCVKDATLNEGVRDMQLNKTSLKIYTWLALKNIETMTLSYAAHDVAIAVFAKGTFPAPSGKYRIAIGDAAAKGQRVTLVGYGAANFDIRNPAVGSGVKRHGHNVIADARYGTYEIRADLTQLNQGGIDSAVAAAGDSGGPLINERNEIVGIGAAYFFRDAQGNILRDAQGRAVTDPTNAASVANIFADLTSGDSRNLLNFATSPSLGEFRAEIPGYNGSRTADFDAAWTTASDAADKGLMIAMCGGGNAGGYNRPNAGGQGYANGGGYTTPGAGGYAGGTGTYNGAGGVNNGLGGGLGGVNPNNGLGGLGGQFNGPGLNGQNGVGTANVEETRRLFASTCLTSGCHSSVPTQAQAYLDNPASVTNIPENMRARVGNLDATTRQRLAEFLRQNPNG